MKNSILSLLLGITVLLSSCYTEKSATKDLNDTTWKCTKMTFTGNDNKNYDAEAAAMLKQVSLILHFIKGGTGSSKMTDLNSNNVEEDPFTWSVSKDGKQVTVVDNADKTSSALDIHEEKRDIKNLTHTEKDMIINVNNVDVHGTAILTYEKQ